MATMNRNINLEEVNSDAFLGISYLNYQSLIQKLVFWGGVIVAVVWNIIGNFVFHINSFLIVLFTLIPIFIGAIFGCNYNQDLSLIKYMYLILFKPANVLVSKPKDGLQQIKMSSERIIKDRKQKEREQQAASPEEQRKLLIKVLAGTGIFILLFVILLLLILNIRGEEIHHIVTMTSAS